MTNLQQNQVINNINTDNALANILDRLSPDYIFHIIEDSVNMRFRPYNTPMPNIVYSLEQTFKSQLEENPSARDIIMEKRASVYTQIIEIICNKFNLEYIPGTDLYSDAFYLYSFFISDFTNCFVTFFVTFILHEKDQIYNTMGLQDQKKNKDAASTYSKKIYNDENSELAAIHANLLSVLGNIITYDISLNNILECVYYGQNAAIANHIGSIVQDKGYYYNFYKEYLINDMHKADAVTLVKFALQNIIGEATTPVE